MKTTLGARLAAHGFTRKGSSWYRRGAGALLVVNLQKSSWGAQFYVNLCCVPDGMEAEVEGMPAPAEHRCPVRIRLTAAFPEREEEIRRAFDLEAADISDADRAALVDRHVDELAAPFLARHMEDAACLRRAVEGGVFDNALAARRHLGMPG